jgi:type II secretory pathway component PulK
MRVMAMQVIRRARGVALIMALLVLTLLVVIVGQLAYSTRIDLQVSRNASDSQSALMAAWGGVEFAKGLLRDDVQHNEHDGAADRWARLTQAIKVGEIAVTLDIDDEDRKLNLLLLRSEHEAYVEFAESMLERIIDEAREGVGDRQEASAAELADALIEWIREGKTPGTAQEQSAAEREDGDEVPPLTLSEFLVVKGWTDEVLFGPPPAPRKLADEDDPYGALDGPTLSGGEDGDDPTNAALDALYGDSGREPRAVADFLTLWSTGRININTAEPIVLASLSEAMSEEVVRAIVARRNSGDGEPSESESATEGGSSDGEGGLTDNAFREVNELREVEGMEDAGGEGEPSLIGALQHYLTVQSHTFKVRATADVGRVRRTVEVVLRRSKSGFRVLWYKER